MQNHHFCHRYNSTAKGAWITPPAGSTVKHFGSGKIRHRWTYFPLSVSPQAWQRLDIACIPLLMSPGQHQTKTTEFGNKSTIYPDQVGSMLAIAQTGSNKAPGFCGKYHLSNHQWQSGKIIAIAPFDYLCLCRQSNPVIPFPPDLMTKCTHM